MKQIPLSRGLFAIVDDADYEWLMQWKWFASETRGKGTGFFYAARQTPHPTKKGKQAMVYMHRAILNSPKGMVTDHINHNTLDNRRENLRVCTNAENLRNRVKSPQCKLSQYKGAVPVKGGWDAVISVGGRPKYIGTYETEREAALAYDRAAEQRYGEYAQLNFPDLSDAPMTRREKGIPRLRTQARSLKRPSKAGYRGVFLAGNGRMWGVKLGKQYLGCYRTAEDAARAYDAKAREVYGASAYQNFPEPTP